MQETVLDVQFGAVGVGVRNRLGFLVGRLGYLINSSAHRARHLPRPQHNPQQIYNLKFSI